MNYIDIGCWKLITRMKMRIFSKYLLINAVRITFILTGMFLYPIISGCTQRDFPGSSSQAQPKPTTDGDYQTFCTQVSELRQTSLLGISASSFILLFTFVSYIEILWERVFTLYELLRSLPISTHESWVQTWMEKIIK